MRPPCANSKWHRECNHLKLSEFDRAFEKTSLSGRTQNAREPFTSDV